MIPDTAGSIHNFMFPATTIWFKIEAYKMAPNSTLIFLIDHKNVLSYAKAILG
jgi:hypothetical protein